MINRTDRPTYGVVIATYGRREWIFKSLASWAACHTLPDQFLVVDATPNAAEYRDECLRTFPSLLMREGSDYICTSQTGSSRQRNLGLKLTTTDIVTFADDDVLVPAELVDQIRDFFALDTDQRIGAVLPHDTEASATSWRNVSRRIRDLLPLGLYRLFVPRAMRFPVADGGMARDISGARRYALQGYALTCRTPLAKQALFDEHLHRYGFTEDFDFSFRLGRDHLMFQLDDISVRHCEAHLSRISDDRYLCVSFVNPAFLIEKLFPNPQSRRYLLRLLRTMKFTHRMERLMQRKGKSLTISSIGSPSDASEFSLGIYDVIEDMIRSLQEADDEHCGALMIELQQYIFQNKGRLDDMERYLEFKETVLRPVQDAPMEACSR